MADCINSYDNRETCVQLLPSSCIPYVGYISTTIKASILECRPNINDILKALQDYIDKIQLSLGDNKTLDKKCLAFIPLTVTQVSLNQLFINEICGIKTQMGIVGSPVNATTLTLAVNLLCLQDPACTPQTTYTLQEIVTKLITAYCNLKTRVTAIETYLNL